ncbi:hypothetical protein E4T43_05853 [Aureobasidium subglaciale]|nr:hypothetical protein E4T43_05853 [Aureobasidium subglaciale]
MPIRPASFADLLPAAHVCAHAFFDEDLFGQRIHPNRSAFHGDVYLFFLRQLRKDFFDGHSTVMISHPKDQLACVTGVAIWTRKGPGGERMAASQSWSAWFTGRFLLPAYNWLGSLIWPNRAADPAMLDVLDRAMPFTEHYWKTPERLENWYLALYGVDQEAGWASEGGEQNPIHDIAGGMILFSKKLEKKTQ